MYTPLVLQNKTLDSTCRSWKQCLTIYNHYTRHAQTSQNTYSIHGCNKTNIGTPTKITKLQTIQYTVLLMVAHLTLTFACWNNDIPLHTHVFAHHKNYPSTNSTLLQSIQHLDKRDESHTKSSHLHRSNKI